MGSCRLDVLISCLVMLLERTDLVASALVHHKVVELLLMMMAPQLDGRRRTGGSGVLAAASGEGCLVFTLRCRSWAVSAQALNAQMPRCMFAVCVLYTVQE